MRLDLPILLADAPMRASYEATRLEELRSMPLVAIIVAALLCAVLAYTWLVYRRESGSVPRGAAWLMTGLRTLALAGVVVLALDIVKRQARELVEPSQVVLVVDTSQSMGLPSASSASSSVVSRGDEIAQLLEQTPLLAELRKRHAVEIVRFAELPEPVASFPREVADTAAAVDKSTSTERLDWTERLQPVGAETRLGDAIHAAIQRHEGRPLAGVVVFSDGGQNAGTAPLAAAAVAKSREISLHTVGFGPFTLPPNIAVRDLIAPKRVYPSDRMTIAGVIEAHEASAPRVQVELLRQKAGTEAAAWEAVADQEVELNQNGSQRIEFSVAPSESGEYVYEFRVTPLEGETSPDDNVRRATVAVVDRKLRVLLFAGGPSKEYQFLRNQLQRDKNVTLDVLLQSAGAGAAQDADSVLTEFPKSREQLFEYDAIVAFDPDWTPLNGDTLQLLESWVAEQAGGMIVAPGPISTRRWVPSSAHTIIRSLYPVVFDPNEVELASSTEPSSEPTPLELTREGSAAEFLRLSDDASDSAAMWEDFPGVFGVQAGVMEAKPGATVYARMIGAANDSGQSEPVFLAEQFFGSGRVFYLNSTELWRLRMVDPTLFERLYTKLVQHVAQGRLQRGSSRGTLLIERDRYELGESVILRARLTDPQLQPLTADSVEVHVLQPDDRVVTVRLNAEQGQSGSYVGDFRVVQPGPHVVSLAIPDSQEELVERIRIELPVLEQQPLVRNESLLQQIATAGGGFYYADANRLLSGLADIPTLPAALPDRSETRIVYSQPDEVFAERLRLGLLGLICGALFGEWIIRRWHRLA